MPEGAAIGLLCALAIVFTIGTLIGAVFLRAAVALSNKMAGGALSSSRVPRPTFGKALWISLGSSLAQMVVGLLVGGVGDSGVTVVGSREKEFDVVRQLMSLMLSLLIMAAIISAKLPTTFSRAILVTLCYVLIVILVVGPFVALAVVLF
jgi:hypothetical protein